MKVTMPSRTYWAIPALTAVITAGGLPIASAQPKAPAKAAATTKTTKAPRPRSKTVQGTFTQTSTSTIRLNAKDGDMNAVLVPTTEYWRVQPGLTANELKVGDTVRFSLKGTPGMATVTSVSPLTLKFDDVATLTLDKPGRMKFERASKLTAADLATGQSAKVASNVFPDGRIEAREVWVIQAPVKSTKTPAPAPAPAQ